ncbi:MAG: biotin/lipoyl-binding protein [Phycisphaerae bacterium]|nr:biotin/lipoyl-binding protein [Phycisphaerae bacterium]
MKKWIILLAAVGLVVVIWYFARQQSFTPDWAKAKFGEVTRGDIKVPITASGLIHANLVVEIKPEASGEVTQVHVVEGTFVKAGQTLVELDPQDEERLRDRAQAEFDRAEAMLTQAQVAVERAQVNIEIAQARLEEINAQGAIAEYEWDKIKNTIDEKGRSSLYSDQQIHDSRYRYNLFLAQRKSAAIAIRSAELSKLDAETVVLSQEAMRNSVEKALEDAEERLRETTVLAPSDAIVTDVSIKAGMLVQSGTQSIMGGTQLMKLADVSKKKVIARLDEADYGRVLDISPIDSLPDMPKLRETAAEDAQQMEQRGGIVRITVDAFPEETFEGRIERVEPQGKLNPGSSIIQFDVHVEITDPQRHLLPLGAQAQVEFTVESALDTLRVPAEAVKTLEDQRGVYVKTNPSPGSGDDYGKKFIPCRFGISDGEFTQVIAVVGDDELKEGDKVYTKLPRDVDELEN